jgi:hypothetical protein
MTKRLQERVAARKLAREEAKSFVEFIDETLGDVVREDDENGFCEAFWRQMAEVIQDRAPSAIASTLKESGEGCLEIRPMSDEEFERYDKQRMGYGTYANARRCDVPTRYFNVVETNSVEVLRYLSHPRYIARSDSESRIEEDPAFNE